MENTHTFSQPLALPMKLLNFFLPLISFIGTATGLEIDWPYVILAASSAIGGSLLFGYFRRERTFGAQLYKIMMATIGGLILGSLMIHWRGYDAPAQISATYCASSMLVLIFLRTVVSLFEENARAFTTTILERVFNYKPDGSAAIEPGRPVRRRTKRSGVHVTERRGDPARVRIEPGAEPDEIRVVEQTVIEKEPIP